MSESVTLYGADYSITPSRKPSHLVVSVFATGSEIRYTVGDVYANWSARTLPDKRPPVHTLLAPNITNFNERILKGLTLGLNKAATLLEPYEDNQVMVEVTSRTVFGWLINFEAPPERCEALDQFIEAWNKVPAKFQIRWVKSPLAKRKLPEVVEEVMDLSALLLGIDMDD